MLGLLRRYLIAGLLVWVPLGVTALVVKGLVDLMDRTLLLLPPPWRPEALLGFSVPGLGLVLALAVLVATGALAANFLGRRLVAAGEAVLRRVPVVRSVYGAVKQVAETLFSSRGDSFRKVLLVEYPRRGCWTLAFLTGAAAPEIERRAGEPMVSVFVPTTPNPTSGFFLMLPRREVVELDMSVDEGLRLLLSMGVVAPGPGAQVAPRPRLR